MGRVPDYWSQFLSVKVNLYIVEVREDGSRLCPNDPYRGILYYTPVNPSVSFCSIFGVFWV